MARLKSTHNMKKIDAVRASRKSGRTFWPEKISNKVLHRMTKSTTRGNVFSEWTGIAKVTLTWEKAGEISQGRPNVVTWQQTLTAELKEANLTKGEAQHAAKDRRQTVEAFCLQDIGGHRKIRR